MYSGEKKASDEPIPGPSPVGPEYIFEPDWDRPVTTTVWIGRFLADLVRKPAHWIRENIVEPNKGPKYYYYHKKFARPLPVDECYSDDFACIYEADLEYKRTRVVDKATLDLLRNRRDACNTWYSQSYGTVGRREECSEYEDTFLREELNYFIKYNDLPGKHTVMNAYNKQKHRMIMERRLAAKKAEVEASRSKEMES